MKNTSIDHISFEQFVQFSGSKATLPGKMLVFRKEGAESAAYGKPFRTEVNIVLMCVGGSCAMNVNTVPKRMSRGAVLVYPRGTVIEFLDSSPDVVMQVMMFDPEMVEQMVLDRKSVMGIIKYFTESTTGPLMLDEGEITIIEKIYDLAASVIETGRSAIVCDVLALLVNTLGDTYNRRTTDKPVSVSRTEEYFGRFLKEVSENYQTERSVRFYADALHITPKYLSTIIKEVSGKSAVSWINDFVIQQAKVHLKFSGKSVQEIAYMLNFSTQSFFGKYFKRYTGMSPSEYRRKD